MCMCARTRVCVLPIDSVIFLKELVRSFYQGSPRSTRKRFCEHKQPNFLEKLDKRQIF